MQALLIADGRIASGGSPLLMHNERLVDPLDEFVRAIRLISKKRNKSDADHLEVGRLEFLAGLYTSPPIKGPGDLNGQVPSIPAWNMIRCLQDGATRQKRGKDVLAGIYPLNEFAELEYTGPSAPEALWKQPAFRLRKTVGVSRSRVMRTRPVFTEWQARLPIEIDDTVFDLDTITQAWHDAGIYKGLGDMRPVYGRFKGTTERIKKEPT